MNFELTTVIKQISVLLGRCIFLLVALQQPQTSLPMSFVLYIL